MSYYLQPLVNGKAYEHSDIQVYTMNQMITGFTDIEYDDNRDVANGHAAGSYVSYRTHGKYNPTAKCSFLMSTLEAFQNVAPNRKIQEIPEFDIVITFIDPALITHVHVLKNCRFKNNGRKAGVGDGAIITDVEIVVADIEFKS